MKRVWIRKKEVLMCVIAFAIILGVKTSMFAASLRSGCNQMKVDQKTVDAIRIVKGLLPKGAILFDPYNSCIPNKVRLQNLDNKGAEEIIAAYRLNKKDEKINILILKHVAQDWVKSLELQRGGIQLDKIASLDIDGDKQNEVLIGRKIGAIWGELEVYKWNKDTLTKVVKDIVSYSKFEIVKLADQKEVGIATWLHDTGKAYKIDVLKWEGNKFISVKDECKGYFKSAVVPYYEKMVKESPKAGFYWYYLVESKLKAGERQEAIKSMSKALKLDLKYPTKADFDKLFKEASNN